MSADTPEDQQTDYGSFYTKVAFTAAVAGVAVTYPKKAHALFLIDDIAIAIAQGIAEMYKMASIYISDEYKEQEEEAAQARQISLGKMGDALNAVKTESVNRMRALATMETKANCDIRLRSSQRFTTLGLSVARSTVLAPLEKAYTIHKPQVLLSQNKAKVFLTPETKSPDAIMHKLSDGAYAVTNTLDTATDYQESLIEQYSRTLIQPGVFNYAAALQRIEGNPDPNDTPDTIELLNQMPYQYVVNSAVYSAMQYGTTPSTNTIKSLYIDTRKRSLKSQYFEELRDLPNEISSLQELLFNVGKEAAHWLEVYRQNEMAMLSLVLKLTQPRNAALEEEL